MRVCACACGGERARFRGYASGGWWARRLCARAASAWYSFTQPIVLAAESSIAIHACPSRSSTPFLHHRARTQHMSTRRKRTPPLHRRRRYAADTTTATHAIAIATASADNGNLSPSAAAVATTTTKAHQPRSSPSLDGRPELPPMVFHGFAFARHFSQSGPTEQQSTPEEESVGFPRRGERQSTSAKTRSAHTVHRSGTARSARAERSRSAKAERAPV